MQTAAALRNQIEATFNARNPSALSPRLRPEVARSPCGVASIDELLNGGLPAGSLVEFVGADCSGRTTMALAYIAAITQAGKVCAWIDVADALDPETAAANDVDLERLLWVRCTSQQQATTQRLPDSHHGTLSPVSVPAAMQVRHKGGGSPHPRSEGRNMPEAVSALLQAHGGLYDRPRRRKVTAVGTPGASNRPLPQRSKHREEQVNSDRLPPRRGENLAIAPRCAEPQPRPPSGVPTRERLSQEQPAVAPAFRTGTPVGKPWQALDQALRVADLLLQGGGFSAIVLDLGNTAPEFALRIPLATWFRFRAACERTRVSLVLLTQHPCARSSAELVVRMQTGTMRVEGKVMTGICYQAITERSRTQVNDARVVSIRKQPQSERSIHWKSEATWAQAR